MVRFDLVIGPSGRPLSIGAIREDGAWSARAQPASVAALQDGSSSGGRWRVPLIDFSVEFFELVAALRPQLHLVFGKPGVQVVYCRHRAPCCCVHMENQLWKTPAGCDVANNRG